MSSHDTWLETAIQTAQEAGVLLRERWGRPHDTRSKGYRDVVTEADIASEKIILSRLHAAFPDHAFTSEEAGADGGESQVRWVIDPVDGTTNFSRNNPNFCISIAAIEAGRPVVGVVYDPLRDHCFTARLNGGAMLNNTPIHVSAIARVEDAVFAADWGKEPELRKVAWSYAGSLLACAQTLRALGAAALNIAYLAAGWIDLYLSGHLYSWDQAAAALIVQEAGGVTATLSGRPWTPDSPDPLFAATPALLESVRALRWGVEE